MARGAASASVLAALPAARVAVIPECRQHDHVHRAQGKLDTPWHLQTYTLPRPLRCFLIQFARGLEDGARRGWPDRRYDAAEQMRHVWPKAGGLEAR
jgi:hypothetical protein